MVENPSMLQIGSKIDITIELVNRMDVTEIIVSSSSSFISLSLLYELFNRGVVTTCFSNVRF